MNDLTAAPAAPCRVLFICLGNICRSPAAEAVFRHIVSRNHAEKRFEIDSAGLIDYHEGELPDSRMRQCAAARGYHLTHRSRPITAADFERADYIVAMDADNVRRLRRLAPRPEMSRKVIRLNAYLTQYNDDCIPDPYYGTAADFSHVIDLLEDACLNLYKTLTD